MLIRFKSLTTHTTAAATDLPEMYFISNAASRLKKHSIDSQVSKILRHMKILNTKDQAGQKTGQART